MRTSGGAAQRPDGATPERDPQPQAGARQHGGEDSLPVVRESQRHSGVCRPTVHKHKVLLKRNKNPPIQDESIIQNSLFLLSHPVFQLVISDMKPSLQMNSEGGDKKKISLKYECNQPERGSSVFFSSNVVFGFFIRK